MTTVIPPKVTVTVTAAHIASGTPRDCATCPIALAVADAFPGARSVAVNAFFARVTLPGHSHPLNMRLPDEASSFAADFDIGYHVEPFAFELETGVAA